MNNNGIMLSVYALVLWMISRMSHSLGLTNTSGIYVPGTPGAEVPEQPEGALAALTYVIDTITSFWQIMTYQMELPAVINTFIVLPIVFYTFWLVLTLVRGGAR